MASLPSRGRVPSASLVSRVFPRRAGGTTPGEQF